MLVASAQFAAQMNTLAPSDEPCAKPLRVVIAGKVSRTASRMLSQVECDVFLKQPVHPTLLLLLVRRAIFRGKERRAEERVAISAPIKFKQRFRSLPGTLVDLSMGGCKLSSEFQLEPGSALTMILPRELTGGRALSLTGSVAAGHDAGFQDLREHAMSVVFTNLDVDDRRSIAKIMSKCGIASTTKVSQKQPPPPPAPEERRSEAAVARPKPNAAENERRKTPRKRYPRTALMKSQSSTVPLIGRDLSLEGIRTEPHSGIAIGDRVGIVLYGNIGAPVAMLDAMVVRDDGDEGLVFSFLDITKERKRRLVALLKALPILRSDPTQARPQPGIVIAQVNHSK
jgi:hypothetical protein